MAERLEQLMLAEKELLANVSHELRTPLARLRVALDIAGESDAVTGRASMAEMGVDLSELAAVETVGQLVAALRRLVPRARRAKGVMRVA